MSIDIDTEVERQTVRLSEQDVIEFRECYRNQLHPQFAVFPSKKLLNIGSNHRFKLKAVSFWDVFPIPTMNLPLHQFVADVNIAPDRMLEEHVAISLALRLAKKYGKYTHLFCDYLKDGKRYVLCYHDFSNAWHNVYAEDLMSQPHDLLLYLSDDGLFQMTRDV